MKDLLDYERIRVISQYIIQLMHFNSDADENITMFLCAWINVVFVWELSDNTVVTIPLLLDAFQTYISYQRKIVIIGKLSVTVMMMVSC